MRLNEKPGYGLDNTMFQFIRFSTIASVFLFANNLSYVNEIVTREPRDKNTGFIKKKSSNSFNVPMHQSLLLLEIFVQNRLKRAWFGTAFTRYQV